eukprot:6193547-Pleurochrysis_carterae.AAC.3
MPTRTASMVTMKAPSTRWTKPGHLRRRRGTFNDATKIISDYYVYTEIVQIDCVIPAQMGVEAA